MGSILLKILNREAAAPKSMARETIERLGLREGMQVADLGSGGGFFTLEFARWVGQAGRVYAIDNKPQNLEFVRKQAARQSLANIDFVPVAGGPGFPNLPEAGIELLFARNVYHHLPQPAAYFRSLKKFLRPGARVVVIDHEPKRGFSFTSMFEHHTSGEQIAKEMGDAGYRLAASHDFLPGQSFNEFEVNDPGS